jgi:hypothetical protein
MRVGFWFHIAGALGLKTLAGGQTFQHSTRPSLSKRTRPLQSPNGTLKVTSLTASGCSASRGVYTCAQ